MVPTENSNGAMEPVAEETTIVAIEPVIIDPANEESDVEKPAPEEAITAPRVHRRTSTLLACTEGCTITTVPYQSQSSSTDIQQLLADALGSKNNGPLTLKTFELQ